MRELRAYVPEREMFFGKDLRNCRFFHDNCLVVDTADGYRVVAKRGFRAPFGTPLTAALETDDGLLEELAKICCEKGAVCRLQYKELVMLALTHLVSTTGLLILLLPSQKSDINAFLSKKVEEIATPVSKNRIMPPTEVGFDHMDPTLAELLFYADSIFAPASHVGLWTHCLRIANFAGCRLEHVSLPLIPVELAHRDRLLLSAFLLCSFLTLREKSVNVATSAKEERSENVGEIQIVNTAVNEEELPLLRLKLEYWHFNPNWSGQFLEAEELSRMLPFLSLPCFSSFTAFQKEERTVLEAKFSTKPENILRSTTRPNTIFFCISFL